MHKIFNILDLNNDRFVDRCEDATFQRAMGATQKYAWKFSGQFNLASMKKICNEEFAS